MTVPTLYSVYLRFATDQAGVPARKWSNIFHVEGDDPTTVGNAFINFIWPTLRGAAYDHVYAYEVYVTDKAPGTDNYAVLPVTDGLQRGTLTPGAGDAYLPKACLAVTLNVPNSRPSRKFWRPGLTEGDVVNGVSVNPALVTAVRNAFNTVLTDSAGVLLDPDGQVLTTVGRVTLTTRSFGRESTNSVPEPPST